MPSRDSSLAELDRSITEMPKKRDELYANPVEDGCSAKGTY